MALALPFPMLMALGMKVGFEFLVALNPFMAMYLDTLPKSEQPSAIDD